MKRQKKIIWPIDPYREFDLVDKNVYSFLKNLNGNNNDIVVQPVHIMTSDFMQYMSDFNPTPTEKIINKIKLSLEEHLKQFNDLNLLSPIVLGPPNPSHKNEVEIVLDFIKKSSAELIVVGSASKEGIERLLLGSFAETLARKSSIPIAVINQNLNLKKWSKKALVPIELDEDTKEFVERLLNYSITESMDEIVFYQNIYTSEYDLFSWTLPDQLAGNSKITSILETIKVNTNKKMKNFVEEFKTKTNIKLSCSVTNEKSAFSSLIEEQMKTTEADLAIINNNSNYGLFLSSNVKKLIRDGEFPTIIFPLKFKKK